VENQYYLTYSETWFKVEK